MSIGQQIDNRLAELQSQIDELRMQIETHEHEPPDAPFPGIQAAYDALPADATELVIPAGTYTEELILNRAGVEVHGVDEVTINGRIQIAANNVTLRNVNVVEGTVASPDYWGAIWSDGVDRVSMLGVRVTGSTWAGVALKGGSGHLLSGVEAYENGALGIRLESLTDSHVFASSMRNNNTRGLDPGWEAGGLKATGNYGGISGVSVEDCEAYSNDGPGIWFDIDAHDCMIRGNTAHHNTRAGIIYELSSGGSIVDNIVYENGWGFRAWGFGAGILIQNSRNCSVSDNVLAWNGDGIVVMSQDRGNPDWNNVIGNDVSGNIIAHEDDNEQWNAFASAVLEDWAGVATLPESGNTGNNNQYFFTRWSDGTWIIRGRNGSTAYYGVPENFAGTGIDKPTLDPILVSAGIPLEPEAR